MIDCMTWGIALRAGGTPRQTALPPAIVTVQPRFRHDSMPDEVGLLLPTNAGPRQLIEAVVADPALAADAMLGLFLADPFLTLPRESARLRQAGVAWIVNLPSVEQQDEDFSQQLTDVGLDRDREFEALARLRADGFSIAAVVADAAAATAAAAIAPQALIVLPRVAEFAAGFPSLRQRGAAAQAVFEAAHGAGWSGLLLALGESSEAEHQSQWPDVLDGLLCRPEPLDAPRGAVAQV